MGKAGGPPCSSICPNRKFQRTGLLVQAPSSANNGMLKIATVVQQIITQLSEPVSKEDKIMGITKMVLNEPKCLLEFIGRSKS
jgi:hypothetical protein